MLQCYGGLGGGSLPVCGCGAGWVTGRPHYQYVDEVILLICSCCNACYEDHILINLYSLCVAGVVTGGASLFYRAPSMSDVYRGFCSAYTTPMGSTAQSADAAHDCPVGFVSK